MAAPGSGFLHINYSGIDRYRNAINTLHEGLKNPEMSAPVRGAARAWEANFNAEGRMGLSRRPWAPLSPYTQVVRARRGYNPTNPILQQSGALKRAATEYPQQFRGKTMNRMTGSPPTLLNIRTSRNFVHLTLVGYKVGNQHGGTTPEGFTLPARPFWGISPQVRRWATEELLGTYEKHLKGFR